MSRCVYTVLLGLALFFASRASFASCPGREGQSLNASASKNHVYLNGTSFRVKTRDDREAFEQVLAACGADEAIPAFEAWRRKRNTVRAASTVGLIALFAPVPADLIAIPIVVSLGSLAVVTPIAGVSGRAEREAMLSAISQAQR